MIGFLRGILLQKQPPSLVIDVNGVGYELEAPMPTFYKLPDEQKEISLYVHMIVREDAQLLYGFSDQGQRQLFRSLLKINGVGAKVALAILSTFSPREFISCIHLEDAVTLTRVPGVGNKTAERIIIDMRDRIDAQEYEAVSGVATDGSEMPDNPEQDAIGALMSLGYKSAEAKRAVSAMKEQNLARDDLIRKALQYLTQ